MKKPVFAVRDVKTFFLSPFVEETDEAAIRGFAYSVVTQHDQILGFSPADFSLYKIGEFDTTTGCILAFPVPQHLFNAVDASTVLLKNKVGD